MSYRSANNIILELAVAARNMLKYNRNHTLLVLRTIERKIPNWRRTLNRNSQLYRVLRNIDSSLSPNHSKASAAVKKWLSVSPHTIHRNMVTIKLPANARDAATWHNFEPGNEAVMIIKKHLQKNGAMRSKRTFYQKSTIERLAGKNWNAIMRMKGSNIVLNKKDPLNRRTVYRRDIVHVKFRD